jgi:hypothetical protein
VDTSQFFVGAEGSLAYKDDRLIRSPSSDEQDLGDEPVHVVKRCDRASARAPPVISQANHTRKSVPLRSRQSPPINPPRGYAPVVDLRTGRIVSVPEHSLNTSNIDLDSASSSHAPGQPTAMDRWEESSSHSKASRRRLTVRLRHDAKVAKASPTPLSPRSPLSPLSTPAQKQKKLSWLKHKFSNGQNSLPSPLPSPLETIRRKIHAATAPSTEPEDQIGNGHLCSFCFQPRPMWFNIRNLEGAPLSFCTACQKRLTDAAMEDPSTQVCHWCHRCGIVRSDEYHLEHPLPDTELKPTFCDQCTEELIDMQAIPERSELLYSGSGEKVSFLQVSRYEAYAESYFRIPCRAWPDAPRSRLHVSVSLPALAPAAVLRCQRPPLRRLQKPRFLARYAIRSWSTRKEKRRSRKGIDAARDIRSDPKSLRVVF